MARTQVRTVTAAGTPSPAALLALYASVGWTAYTRDPDAIPAALDGSSFAAAAWDGERLVGLARVVSDDVTLAYVQDVLVHADAQGGVGSGRR